MPLKKIIMKTTSSKKNNVKDDSDSEEITDSDDNKSQKILKNKKTNDKSDKEESDKEESDNDDSNNEEYVTKKILIDNYSEKTINTYIKNKNTDGLTKLLNNYIYDNNSQLDKQLNYVQNESKWIKKYFDKSKDYYYEYNNCPRIKYISSEELINQLIRCKEIKEYLQNFKPNYPDIKDNRIIYKILKITSGDFTFITCTKQSIETAFKSNLLYRLIYDYDENDKIWKGIINMKEVTCEILGCLKGNLKPTDIEKIKKSLDTDKNKLEYKKYQKIILNMIPKDIDKTIKRKLYYIYKIKDTKTHFIFGSYDLLNSKNIKNICKKFNLTFEEKCNIEQIDKRECLFECEGLCKVDEHIIQNNSLNCGLNRCFNLILPLNDEKEKENDILIKETIFMHIQSEIMKNNYKDPLQKDIGCYIALISNNKNSFIFYETTKTLKDKLTYYYSLRKEYSNEKIIGILSTTPFEELKINVLERNININRLEEQYYFYIRQMGIYNKNDDDKKDNKNMRTRYAMNYYANKYLHKQST